MKITEIIRRPLQLLPNRTYRTYLGGELMDVLQRNPNPHDNEYPEDWVGSITRTASPDDPEDEGLSHVQLPDGEKVLLRDLIQQDPAAFLGEAHTAEYGGDTGLLVKLLDSRIRLPLQAHPSREFVRQHLTGRYGKTESWLVLDTRKVNGEEPYLLVGFKQGIELKEWLRMTVEQDIEGQVAAVHRFPVEPGDIWFLPAGLAHAIGSGVLMVEVQEPSDWVVLTEFTVGDIEISPDDCHMGLGFEKALQAFDYTGETAEEVEERYKRQPRLVSQTAGGKEWELIGSQDTTYFGARRLDVESDVTVEAGSFYIAIAIQGDGAIEGDFGRVPLPRGHGLFITASMGAHRFVRTNEEPFHVMRCLPADSK